MQFRHLLALIGTWYSYGSYIKWFMKAWFMKAWFNSLSALEVVLCARDDAYKLISFVQFFLLIDIRTANIESS